MAYLLDANAFIAAKNLHYGLDFCPAFWDWLIASNESGIVFSVEKVGDEVQAVADELSEWASRLAHRSNSGFTSTRMTNVQEQPMIARNAVESPRQGAGRTRRPAGPTR
jgi:hypothetical protein